MRADQRIATAQVVIQEREWAVLCDCRQPERELRQVYSQRVEVDAVDAGLRHAPLPIGEIGLTSRVGRGLLDVLDQKAGDVLGSLDREVPAPHRRIQYLDVDER